MSDARPDHGNPRQEPDRLGWRGALFFLLLALVIIAAGVGWAWDLLDREMAHARPGLALAHGPQREGAGEGPRRLGGLLQAPIAREWGYRRAAPPPAPPDEDLESWSWVDPGHRYARIPVEKAMEIVVQNQGAPLPEPGGAP